MEFDFSSTEIKYKKKSVITELKQNNSVLMYSGYFNKFMLKGGIHSVDTTDTDLDNGLMMMAGVGGYDYVGYDKKSYGVDGYYTLYKDIKRKIDAFQVTPYFSYSKNLGTYTKNNFLLKANYIYIPKYIAKEYVSFEFTDTLYYKSIYSAVGLLSGDMKNGVRDGGFTLYNSKDELNAIYSLQIGYYFNSGLNASIKYAITNLLESGTLRVSNSAAVLAVNYLF